MAPSRAEAADAASSEEYYIGVDVGTGSARACVINATGDIVGVASKDIRTWQPALGFYEQSTTDIWRSIGDCIKRALGIIPGEAIKGIGFCATCSLAVFSASDDAAICITPGPELGVAQNPTAAADDNINSRTDIPNVVLWLDHRPVTEAQIINATRDRVLDYVGGSMSVEMEIPKILWLKNHMSHDRFQECKFYDLTDALTHLATGSETRSFCSAVCKQGYLPKGVDEGEGGWKDEFFQAIGLGVLVEEKYARLGGVDGANGKFLSAGELVGGLSEKAAAELGLPAGIPVGSGVIDAYAGWIGTVGAKHDLSSSLGSHNTTDASEAFGRLAAVAGTSTCHLTISKNPIFVNGVWGPYRDVLIPDLWLAEGGQSATGELLKFVVETHPAYADAMMSISTPSSPNTNIYELLDAHLAEMAHKADAPSVSYLGRHFFLYGDLWGNRSPLADPHMTGSIIGLRSDRGIDSLALIYYGALEFIALQTRHIIQAMNTAGHAITELYMSGSQCKNRFLMHLIATLCEVPVIIPQYVDAAVVHGAAMLGVKAATSAPATSTSAGSEGKEGERESLWSIMARMSKRGTVVLPGTDEREKKLLGVKYKVFLEQASVQRVYRAKVDEAVNGWENRVE